MNLPQRDKDPLPQPVVKMGVRQLTPEDADPKRLERIREYNEYQLKNGRTNHYVPKIQVLNLMEQMGMRGTDISWADKQEQEFKRLTFSGRVVLV